MFRYLSLVVLVGCASAAPPQVGPQGEQGPVGPAGPAGDAGPQGIQGPAGPAGTSLVSVQPLPAGSLCVNGGALLKDSDGGMAALCNGADGANGAPGATGAQGATGARGAQGPALTLSNMAGSIGPILPGTISVDFVYVTAAGCAGQIDWTTNTVRAMETAIHYTGPNCTGSPFVRMYSGALFPLGCMSMGADNWRVLQPVSVQTFTASSVKMMFSGAGADGGSAAVCTTSTAMGPGFLVEPSPLVNISGPFTLGIQ